MSEQRRRANYAGRNEENSPRLVIRMSAEERSRLEAKAEIAGIPPRAGSLGDPNLAEATRRAIEAWQPVPMPPPQDPPAPPKKGTKRIFARG